jgi:hypothetical protein
MLSRMFTLPLIARPAPCTTTVTVFALGAVVVGCASSSNLMERQKDGSYRLECQATLANCLKQVEEPCAAYGYEVLRGRQEARVFGPEQVQSKYVNSEAVVMCRNAEGWIDDTPQPRRNGNASAPSASPTPSNTCVPGASHKCTGAGGCEGGQTCAPDGKSYLPCDCGAAAAPPAASTPMTTPVTPSPTAPEGPAGSAPTEPEGPVAPAPEAPAPPTSSSTPASSAPAPHSPATHTTGTQAAPDPSAPTAPANQTTAPDTSKGRPPAE